MTRPSHTHPPLWPWGAGTHCQRLSPSWPWSLFVGCPPCVQHWNVPSSFPARLRLNIDSRLSSEPFACGQGHSDQIPPLFLEDAGTAHGTTCGPLCPSLYACAQALPAACPTCPDTTACPPLHLLPWLPPVFGDSTSLPCGTSQSLALP